MTLPEKVKIGPITYNVCEVDAIDNNPIRMGQFNSLTGEILIRASLRDDVKLVTFWHEVVHAICETTGQKQSERLADALSHSLVSLFEANGWRIETT
jgi:Zn-dependent peptidase ImmA (M78 family)